MAEVSSSCRESLDVWFFAGCGAFELWGGVTAPLGCGAGVSFVVTGGLDCAGDEWLVELASPIIRTAKAKFSAWGTSGTLGAATPAGASCGTAAAPPGVSEPLSVTSRAAGIAVGVIGEAAVAAAASVGPGLLWAGAALPDGTAELAELVGRPVDCSALGFCGTTFVAVSLLASGCDTGAGAAIGTGMGICSSAAF